MEEKTGARKAREVFWAYTKSMLFAFTGGNMTLPLLQQQLSERYQLIEKDKVLEYFALGQTLPGVISLNAGIMIGRHICGWPGAIAAVLGCVLPAFFGMLFITLLYGFLSGLSVVAGAIAGIRAASIAILLGTGVGILRLSKGAFDLLVAAAAFLCTFVLGWNIVLVILGCGFAGVLRERFFPGRGGKVLKGGGEDAA